MYKFLIAVLMACSSLVSYASQQQYNSYSEAKAAMEAKCQVTCVILSKEEAIELTMRIQEAIYEEGQAGYKAGLIQGMVSCLKDEQEEKEE